MISRDCLRRGIFRSVPDLIRKIITYVRLYNRYAQPFRWTYPNPRKRIRMSLNSVHGLRLYECIAERPTNVACRYTAADR